MHERRDVGVAEDQGRISKHPDVRREELLAAALKLFMEVGYQKTSVQMITDRVGVAKGLFYHYFDSKTDLLAQLGRWQSEQFLSTLPAPADIPGNALDKIRLIIGMIVQWKFEDARDLISTYLHVLYRPENAQLRSVLVSESTSMVTPIFSEIIAEGVEEGVCEVDDPTLAAEIIMAMWVGTSERLAALLMAVPEHPENIDEVISRVRAWESAIERVLAIEPGTLELYDYEFLQKGLVGLVDPQAEQNAIPPPAESA
jgi:AcrR family transcriptional regulator